MVVIKYDENYEMMQIHEDGDCIFSGNYWDFNADPCSIAFFLRKLGHTVKIHQYNYEEE